MSLIYEGFLRETHSSVIQEWFDNLKQLLEELEELPDPNPADVELAFHLTSMIESFSLMESNLVERRRNKNKAVHDIFDNR